LASRLAITTLVWLVAALANGLHAESPRLVEKALENMESTDISDWSYTVTTSRHGKKTVERHDATKPEGSRWQLLLKSGETPTADEIAEYLSAKRDQAEQKKRRRGKNRGEREISALVDASSVELLVEDDARATYSFRMKVEDKEDRKLAEHVRCTLVVDKALPHVERLEMLSTDEIKPAIGVKISRFHVLMRFDRDEVTGTVLPRRLLTTIKGRAFFVKSLDENIVVSFADYEKPAR
jgi:hypothetical protein